MPKETKIQWCDSTVNPIMGCAGCELFPSPSKVLEAVDEAIADTVSPLSVAVSVVSHVRSYFQRS